MRVHVSVLGSGSKGNCTAVWTDSTALFVDAGALPLSYIERQLADAGLAPGRAAGVLVTHAHSDHVGLTTYNLCRRYRVPVYTHPLTWKVAVGKTRRLKRLAEAGLVHYFRTRTIHIGDFAVTPFRVPHGVPEKVGTPVGFQIATRDASPARLFYATDLGHVPDRVVRRMALADLVVLESNHDVEMEVASSRHPDHIDWVLSDRGHLSNEQASRAIERALSGRNGLGAIVVLAHLSEECNTPELALATAQRATRGLDGVRIVLARQRERTPTLTVGR